MAFVFILISILPGVFPHSTCSIHICLRWTSRQDILKIICTIDDLHLPVYIHNNFGEEIARCSIPFPFPLCTPTNNNTIVQQNVYTNETIVRVRRRIDHYINGNWSCRHGLGRNKLKADIEINIPKLKEQNKSAGNDEFRCMKEIAFYTMTGVVISVVTFCMCLCLKCKCKSTEKRREVFKIIALFSKEIDKCFESKRCKKYSVNNIKIFFFISFVLLVLVSGALIGVIEKDLCSGSFIFIVFGMTICFTLLILFIRIKEDVNSVNEELNGSVDERANVIDETDVNCVDDEGVNC